MISERRARAKPGSVLRNLPIDCRPPPSSLRSPADLTLRRPHQAKPTSSSSSVAPTARAPAVAPIRTFAKTNDVETAEAGAQPAPAGRSDRAARPRARENAASVVNAANSPLICQCRVERAKPSAPCQCCGICRSIVDHRLARCARAADLPAPTRRSRHHHRRRSPRPPELQRSPRSAIR